MSTATATRDPVDAKRAAFNPFEGCPWVDFFEELTFNYMRREDKGWKPPGPHHERLLNDFASGRHLIRLAHRRSLKTTATLAYLIANLEYKSGFHVGWIGNNETLAYEKADSEFNKLVERNPWLTNLQKSNRTKDQRAKKEFPNDCTLTVGWLFGGIEGVGVDILAVDDIVKEKGDGDMQEIDDWLSSVIVPIQEDGGQTLVIGTRKTTTDIYSYLDEREGFQFTEYPAVLDIWDAEYGEDAPHRRPDPDLYTEAEHPLDADRTAQVLWPERGTDYLRDARSKQSEHAWMREFNLVVQTREGAVYPMFDSGTDGHVTDGLPNQVDYHFHCLDWGSGHPAGMLAAARTRHDEYVILDEVKQPVSGTSDYVDALGDFQRDYGPGMVGCDPSDKRGIDDLQGEGFDAVAAENDIEAGLRVVKDLFSQDRLFVHERCEELIAELKAYRYNPTTGKPVKKNDHLVDALRYGLMAEKYAEPDEKAPPTF